MSRKHIQRYIDEFAFRFNTRTAEMGEKFAMVVNQISKSANMSYVGLIGPELIEESLKINYEKGQTAEKTQTDRKNIRRGAWCYRPVEIQG
jgi:hypothetical protein